jgi:hypothetical protein
MGFMKIKVFFLLLFGFFPPSVFGAVPPGLSGEWKLTEFIYSGKTVPPFNPNLNLRFTFFSNGTDRLYWDRKDEDGFCERFASFTLNGDQLAQKIFAVNPLNRVDCAKDPDMQPDFSGTNKIEVKDQEILLHMQLGEEELIYVLKPAPL